MRRGAERARVDQSLLNTILRLRRIYLLRSLRDEQLAVVVADAVGPIRAYAEASLDLPGSPAASPKAALVGIAARLPGADWDGVLAHLSLVRETGALPPGVGAATLLRLIELAAAMRTSVDELRKNAR